MSYTTLVQFMNEWNWLLSGLSAGAFAVFFNWFMNRKQAENSKKTLIYFVLLELRTNYERTINHTKMLSVGQRNLNPFINRHEWNNARNSLSRILPAETLAKIEIIYRSYTEIEAILCRPIINSIDELYIRYQKTIKLTQEAAASLNKEVDEAIEFPTPDDFIQR